MGKIWQRLSIKVTKQSSIAEIYCLIQTDHDVCVAIYLLLCELSVIPTTLLHRPILHMYTCHWGASYYKKKNLSNNYLIVT